MNATIRLHMVLSNKTLNYYWLTSRLVHELCCLRKYILQFVWCSIAQLQGLNSVNCNYAMLSTLLYSRILFIHSSLWSCNLSGCKEIHTNPLGFAMDVFMKSQVYNMSGFCVMFWILINHISIVLVLLSTLTLS